VHVSVWIQSTRCWCLDSEHSNKNNVVSVQGTSSTNVKRMCAVCMCEWVVRWVRSQVLLVPRL